MFLRQVTVWMSMPAQVGHHQGLGTSSLRSAHLPSNIE